MRRIVSVGEQTRVQAADRARGAYMEAAVLRDQNGDTRMALQIERVRFPCFA